MREYRKEIAQETLEILKQGFYIAPSGKSVNIHDVLELQERIAIRLHIDPAERSGGAS